MFSEKTRLIEKRENPFYGSYKENNVLEEIHWQNRRKKQQLSIVTGVIIVIIVLAIGITLAITLPPLLASIERNALNPANPDKLLPPSPSVLERYENAGISSESSTCSDIGRVVLDDNNGTVVDAAVAMVLCHGVVAPQSSGLGGGLFMTIYSDGQMYALNARETAPSQVDVKTYEDEPSAAAEGGLAVGIPGELAGLWEAHQRFGKLPWADLVKFSRDLAQSGFTVGAQLGNSLKKHEEKIKADPILRSEFVNPITGEMWVAGDVIQLQRLAATLQDIEENGITGFYNGTLAEDIVSDITDAAGILTVQDLSSYSVEWLEPVSKVFNNTLTLYSLPFPSSGPLVALGLGILEGFGRKNGSSMTAIEAGLDAHRLAETLKFVNAHRAQIADPNFSELTSFLEKVLSQEYASELRARIEPYKTFDDPRHYKGVFAQPKDSGTTQISIIGPDGDAVSITTTINLGFGAGFMGNLTGIIFNNEMNDFSIVNETDVNGLPSNPGNYIEPGKRPGSSMAPLIFLNARNEPVLATGGSGGETILGAVLTATWRALYREENIKTAIDYPRFLPNFGPTELKYEYGLTNSVVMELERRGHRMHRIKNGSYLGNVNSVCRTKETGLILANADFRKNGGSAGF